MEVQKISIYIPGMEMPTSCFECKLLDYTDTFKCRYRFESLTREHGINISRPDWCPLVPVPEHGRLIDADALDDILADQSEDTYNRTHAPRSWEKALSAMRDYLDGAPTIIPADKEGEG